MRFSSFSAYLRSALTCPSTESLVAADKVEREYVFYGKMDNVAELDRATGYEDQEQWRVYTRAKDAQRETTIRVRKSTPVKRMPAAGQGKAQYQLQLPIYTLTVKSFVKGQPGNLESEAPLSPEDGEALMKILKAEGDGMIKRRYFFAAQAPGIQLPEGTQWEVDVFFATPPHAVDEDEDDGTYFQPYVKLDLEVLAFDLQIHMDPKDPRHAVGFDVPFPITLSDVLYSQPHNRSPEDEAELKKIMDSYMKAKV